MLVKRWQQIPSTALSEAAHGQRWSITDQLLALAVDALHSANWQRAGKKTAQKPKPIPRPWETKNTQTLGKDPIPISQFDDWWESKSRR